MKGIAISAGIGLGKVLLFEKSEIKILKENIHDIKMELDRFEDTLNKAEKEIEDIYNISLEKLGEKEAEIFKAHKMILKDPEYIGGIKNKITEDKINSEWAIEQITSFYVSIFENMEDAYIKERALDLKDVSNRLLRILLKISNKDLSDLDEKTIIVAEDLTPSDTAQIDKAMVAGIITEIGGRTSHTGIMARTMNIPGVSGIKDIRKKVVDGDFIILDGKTGEIFINPNQEMIHIYNEKKRKSEEEARELEKLIDEKSISKDGHKVEIGGNIGTFNDIDDVIKNGGEGVGLYRTEFLYMDSSQLPTEEEQFNAYRIVAEKLDKKPLVIRTLDVGGDKDIPYLNIPKEMNPFLGYRAIRFCLDNKEIFKTQLRAILRASNYGNIKIMFPMISSIEELRASKEVLEEVKEELRRDKIDFDQDVEVGIMVEIPSVAIHSRIFAKEVDFFSIGTNDLIQYTLAVDRGNQEINHLYNQYNPAVLSLIKITIENGHKEGIWVGMCGEVAGDMKLIPVLLAMGLDEFSMSASSILKARQLIRSTNKKDLEKFLDDILNLATAKEVEEFLEKFQ